MDELKKLYDVLARDEYYTKSFDDFKVQFSDEDYQGKVFDIVSRDGLFTKSKEEFINKYSLKKKDEEKVLESISRPLQEGITSGTKRPMQVGESESSPGLDWTKQSAEDRYSINKPKDLPKEAPKEDVQPQIEDPKCDPTTQVFDASSNQCVEISSITEVFNDTEKFTFNSLFKENPNLELSKNKRGNYIVYSEGKLGREGQWYVVTDNGLEKGQDMGAQAGFSTGVDVIPLSDVESFDYQEIQSEGPQDAFSLTEKVEDNRKVKRNKVADAFKADEREVTIKEKEVKKDREIKFQEASDELLKTGFESQRDGDLFRKYINEDEDRKDMVDQHLESLGLNGGLTAEANQSYNNRYIKEAIKVAGKDYLKFLDQNKVQKATQDYLSDNIETYKDNPVVSGVLKMVSDSPITQVLTTTADLIREKSQTIKDFIEPRIEKLNKNFDKFDQVYSVINKDYYNYEGDAPPIFDVDGASTAKAEAKMITEFNSQFVDPITGIVNIPYDELKKISEKTGLSKEEIIKFSKQYELLYMDNMDKDLDLEYTSFQLKRYNDFLSDAGMIDPNAKDYETALGKYYFDKENYGRNALKKFPFEDKEVTDEIFTTKLYDLNEDEFSNTLSGIFSPYGVNFYPIEAGKDVVKVVASNGKEMTIHWRTTPEKRNKKLKELQSFLQENTSSRNVLSLEEIAQLKSGFSLKSVDKQWVNYNKNKVDRAANTLKETGEDIKKEIESFNENLGDKQKQYMKEVAASVGITEDEFNSSMVEFSEKIGLSNVYKDIEKEKVPEVFMSLLNKGLKRQVENGVIKTEEQYTAAKKNLENSLKVMGEKIDIETSAFGDHISQKERNLKERALDYSVEVSDHYKATNKHYNMESQMGSVLGFTWDNLLNGAGSLGAAPVSVVLDAGEATGVLGHHQTEAYRETYLPAIRSSLTDAYGAGTYDAYMQETEKTFLGGAWGGLMKSLPPILASIAGGGVVGAASFALQQVDFLDQEFENDPNLQNLSLADKWTIKAPIAIVNGILENYGLTQAIKGGNSLSTRLLINGLNKIGKKGTKKQLINIIEADIENSIARGLIRIGKGGITEFETGFLQQLNETGVKELYDHYLDDSKKNLFKTALDEGGVALLKESAYAGAQEAIGGFIMATPQAISKGIQEGNLGQLSTDLQFNFIESVVNDPMSKQQFLNQYKLLISSENLTTYQARVLQEDFNKAQSIVSQINPNADISDRKKSFDLINEKKKIEQEVAGKDKFTVQEKYDRINEINKELAEISKYASENVNTIGEAPTLNKVRQEDNITDADNEIIEQAENIIYGSPKDKGQVVLTRDQVQKAKKELDELIDRLDNSGSLESMELADELRAMSEAVSNQPVNHSIYFNERVNDENAQKIHNELVEKNQFKPKTTYIINNKEVSAREFDGKMKDSAFQQELKDGKSSYSVINAPESKIAELEGMPTKPKEGKPVIKVTEEATTEVKEEVVIDKPAITENTTSETNRIKGLDAKAEDGQTFNLDGTTYNEGGLVVPVMSINTTQEEITPEKIAEFVEQNQESIGDAGVVKVGIYKFPNSNQVSIDLNIVVPSENREVALEFGRLAGQESLFDLSTFENVKTGSDGKNPVSFTPEQFRQIASALKENKLPGVFEQEAAVKEEVAPTETRGVSKVRKATDKAVKAISKILPDVKIVLHETDQGYREATGEQNIEDSSNGEYNSKTKEIHINLSKATTGTVAHEVFHAVILNKLKTDAATSKVTKNMVNALSKTLEEGSELKKYLDDFVSDYDQNIQNEEKLAEMVAILAENYVQLSKPNQNLILRWLNKIAKAFGLKQFTEGEVIDLLNTISGKIAVGEEISEADIKVLAEGGSTFVTGPTTIKKPSKRKQKNVVAKDTPYDLSFVTKDDIIDIDSLIQEISDKNQKVWFWVADQLGRGMYSDIVINEEHYLDAGPSYALDPKNRNKNVIWATGKKKSGIEKLIGNSDYIFIISGSPISSKLFNKRVINLLEKRVGSYSEFKKGVLENKPIKPIKDVLEKHNSWEELSNSPDRKKLLSAIESVKEKKDTPLKRYLEGKNAFIDINSLRDGFYAENDFQMNDVMLVLKPTDFGGKSSHSTYENDILGEVVGVPDKKVNSFEIMPDSIKSKYSEALKESQKAQVVAPYGIGVREVSPAKRKQKKKSKKITTKQIIGKPKRKKIVVDEVAALKDQIRLEARAAREAKRDLNARRKELAEFVKDLKRAGKISTNQARAIIGKLSAVNLDNTKAVDSFISYIDKVYADAEYAAKVVEANGLRKKIKKKGKTKKADAKLIELAKSFSAIDPRFVENIDEYIETANSVLEGVIPSRVVGTDIKWRTSPSIIKVNEYIENQLKVQEKAILDLKKAEFESITGIDPKDLSFKDMMDILSGEKEVDPDKEKIIRDNVNKAFNAYKAIIQSILNTEVDPFTGDKLNLTDSQIETIKDFINMDLSLLSVRDAISAVDSLNNFITNGSTGGMVSTFKIYKGSKNAKELADKGINASKLKLFFSKKVGRLHSEQIVSIPIMFERMFKGVKRGGKVMKMMGFTDTVNSTNRARREVTDTIDQYSNKFSKAKPNNQAFNTALNITERGVLGFMRRTVVGNKEAQNKEFERRKGLIKQSIDYLMNEGTEQEQKRGREYKEVYDKILEDSTSIEQMESKASNINLEAVRWWNNTWASKYEQLSDTSLNVYNKILGSDINYIPDIFRKTDITDPGEFNWEDSAFSAATNTLYQKKIGVLEEATRPGKLPKNRYISLDFDTNNLSTLQGALVDIYTAPSIKQIKGFMESDSFSKLFPSREDRDILERRIKRYVRSVRGKDYVTRSELNNFKRLIEFIAGLGVTRALGGVTQPVKQTVPVAINTLINAGRLDIMSSFNPEIQKFLNESGYAIANRGIASETTLDNINKAIDKAAKNSLSKTVNIIEDLNRKWLKVFLVNPDAYIARASWISYYKQYLNKKGVDTQGIDWSTHELNEGAADYAQQQVDRQQNISDSDLQGEFFASKSPGVQIAKKIIVPFMNFVINQKSRMYSDMIILGSKTASVEDRKIAARSLSGLLAETAAFNGVKWGIYSMLITPIVYSLLGVDESDEEKEKRENFLLKMSVTNAFLDIASPFPTLDYPLLWGANKALDLIQTDIKEEDRFQFWNKDSEDFAESLGVLGIAGKKVMDLIDIGDMYFTGEYEQEFFGKKVIKKLDKEQQDVMGVMLILGALYNIGLAPSETSTVVNQVVRNVKKKGKTEKQIEGERKKVSKEASEYSRTRGKRSRGTSRPRTSRGTSR